MIMDLLDITRQLNKTGANKEVILTEDILNQYIEALGPVLINQGSFEFNPSIRKFVPAMPILDKSIDSKVLVEFKHAINNGVLFEGIPGEFVYYVKLAIKHRLTPNKALMYMPASFWKEIFEKDIKNLKEVMNSIYGYNVSLLSSARPYVLNKDTYEVYIPNIDNVLIINKDDIPEDLHMTSFENVFYNKEDGVHIGGEAGPLLRELVNPIAYAVDDLDLRGGKDGLQRFVEEERTTS